MFAGFSVGGVDWPKPELIGVTDPLLRRQIQRQGSFQEAAITRQLGGNLIRVFFGSAAILGDGPANEIRVVLSAHLGQRGEKPVYLHTLAERLAQLDKCDSLLDQLLAGLAQDCTPTGLPLDFEAIDDYVAGVEQYNANEPDASQHVRLLLTQVESPPRWIIEAPAALTLQSMGRQYTFASLWHRYLLIHIHILRAMVRRYVTQRPPGTPTASPAVMAFEICNEPDYEWIPDEMRIERAVHPHTNVLRKYVTELHLPQIPETDVAAFEFEIAPWGYQEQDGEWRSPHPPVTSVLDFQWGRKFDWYVKCYADFQEHMSYAIRDEARQGSAPLLVISGGVTHNNLDYLIRTVRANPNAFAYVDRIGLHPYHWPFHDIWDSNFISTADKSDWRRASPREFALSYFKRFDFLEEVAALTRDPVQGQGLFGKPLWLTEFGIGTKKLGQHNTPVKEYTRFIRERSEPELPDGIPSMVWEDLWDAFFAQVDAHYLRQHGVETILFYTLREAGMTGFDKHDDDRSNLSLTKRDGTPRMDEATFQKFAHFMREVTGQPPARRDTPMVRISSLQATPWRIVTPPSEVLNAMTMLSTSERALLYWLARDYYTGAGEIVDGGCFVGGSTLALAYGLLDGGHEWERPRIHVYDLFASDPYMVEYYFKPLGITCTSGESFRTFFDANTRSVASLLQVNQGDICQIGWTGEPIEIMFIDISKHWSINDVLLTDFFPCLIPGRSVVIQQDFIFEWCPWLAVTMEYLADYFEYIAFVEHNSTVYLHTRPIPSDVLQVKLWDFPLERKVELMDRAIGRFSGYARGMLECAKAALLLESGKASAAIDLLAHVRGQYPEDQIILRAADGVETAARQALA
jgi:hypothetical protein